MHRLSLSRRIISLALGLVVIIAGLVLLLDASSWRISNSRWERAGFPWKIDLVDAEIADTKDSVLTECDIEMVGNSGTSDWPYADEEQGRTIGGKLHTF